MTADTAAPLVGDAPGSSGGRTGWWRSRRLRYNAYLVPALVLGFLAYTVVLHVFRDTIGQPIVDQRGVVIGHFLDSGGIESFVQCVGTLVAILLANLCYSLGPACERFVPARWVPTYRVWVWRAGVVFSCTLPFSIALLHLVWCLFFPEMYDHTPIGPSEARGTPG